MSWQATQWALQLRLQETGLGRLDKLVLLGLAEHAGETGSPFTNAFPSNDTLAGYAECDKRSVRRAKKRLIDRGLIRKTGTRPSRLGGHGVSIYELLPHGEQADSAMSACSEPSGESSVQEDTAVSGASGQECPGQADTAMSAEPPSVNHPVEKPSLANSLNQETAPAIEPEQVDDELPDYWPEFLQFEADHPKLNRLQAFEAFRRG